MLDMSHACGAVTLPDVLRMHCIPTLLHAGDTIWQLSWCLVVSVLNIGTYARFYRYEVMKQTNKTSRACKNK